MDHRGRFHSTGPVERLNQPQLAAAAGAERAAVADPDVTSNETLCAPVEATRVLNDTDAVLPGATETAFLEP